MAKRVGFVGMLADRSKKVATIDEINEAAAAGWAGPISPSERDAGEPSFHERGQADRQHYRHKCLPAPADEVLAKLQAKLDARRRRLR